MLPINQNVFTNYICTIRIIEVKQNNSIKRYLKANLKKKKKKNPTFFYAKSSLFYLSFLNQKIFDDIKIPKLPVVHTPVIK